MKDKNELCTGTLNFKEAWDRNVIDIENFISFVAYFEQRSKDEVLQEFMDEVKKEFH